MGIISSRMVKSDSGGAEGAGSCAKEASRESMIIRPAKRQERGDLLNVVFMVNKL
jgi:hypothetical protein